MSVLCMPHYNWVKLAILRLAYIECSCDYIETNYFFHIGLILFIFNALLTQHSFCVIMSDSEYTKKRTELAFNVEQLIRCVV